MEDNMNNILASIKKLSGVSDWDDVFDSDLLLFINGNILALYQMGVSEAKNFVVTAETLWTELMVNCPLLNIIKAWLYLKVRMQFDPPSSSVADGYDLLISEYEWRINNAIDYKSSWEVSQ